PPQLPSRQPRAYEHALGLVLALLDRRPESVELGELAALAVGEEQVNRLVAVGEPRRDSSAQLVQPLAGQGGHLQRLREAVRQTSAAKGVDRVDLVDHDLERELLRADLAQDCRHGARLFVEPIVRDRRIDDVQDEVRDEGLLERRREPFDELRRQPADETDRVGDEVLAPIVFERASRRIERLEQAVVDRDLGGCERVQERRLPDVGVARQRDGRRFDALPLLAPYLALLAQLLQATSQQRDAATGDPAVGLQLRLARAARADTTPEPLEVLPHAPHAREVVLELRELNLQLALRADRVLREDVEDQLRAVDDARLQRVLEQPLLRRLELVVDQQHLRA